MQEEVRAARQRVDENDWAARTGQLERELSSWDPSLGAPPSPGVPYAMRIEARSLSDIARESPPRTRSTDRPLPRRRFRSAGQAVVAASRVGRPLPRRSAPTQQAPAAVLSTQVEVLQGMLEQISPRAGTLAEHRQQAQLTL